MPRNGNENPKLTLWLQSSQLRVGSRDPKFVSKILGPLLTTGGTVTRSCVLPPGRSGGVGAGDTAGGGDGRAECLLVRALAAGGHVLALEREPGRSLVAELLAHHRDEGRRLEPEA